MANFYLGKTPERNNLQNWGNDFPWVSIADMKDKSIINHTKEKISNYALSNKFNNQFSPKGTLIMSFTFKEIFQKVAKKWATILGNEWLTL